MRRSSFNSGGQSDTGGRVANCLCVLILDAGDQGEVRLIRVRFGREVLELRLDLDGDILVEKRKEERGGEPNRGT